VTIIETPVPLLQHHDEFTQLLDLYRQIKPERVLEVGTYHGGSLYHWLQNAAPKATIVTIDSYTTGVDNSDQYTNWATSNADVVVIRGDSESSDPTIQVAPLWAELANEWETVEFRSDGGWGIGIVLMP
jgi:cephalosporin hydroxylase